MHSIESLIDTLIDRLYIKQSNTLTVIEKQNEIASCNFIARSSGVLSGIDIAKIIYKKINPQIGFEMTKKNGDYINRGDVLAVVSGPVVDILRGEKLATNFVRYLTGIASLTNKYVMELSQTDSSIVYSGYANPIYEPLVKEAFINGGGLVEPNNELVLLSANYLARFDTFEDGIKAYKEIDKTSRLCLEVRDIEEISEAFSTNCQGIRLITVKEDLFDRLSNLANTRKRLEVCGNIDLKKVRGIALKGFKYLYIPSLTDDAASFPIDLCFYKRYRKIGKKY